MRDRVVLAVRRAEAETLQVLLGRRVQILPFTAASFLVSEHQERRAVEAAVSAPRLSEVRQERLTSTL